MAIDGIIKNLAWMSSDVNFLNRDCVSSATYDHWPMQIVRGADRGLEK